MTRCAPCFYECFLAGVWVVSWGFRFLANRAIVRVVCLNWSFFFFFFFLSLQNFFWGCLSDFGKI